MNIFRKIKVLVVDDSLFYRELISRGISTDNNIKVIATAVDAYDARDKILKYKPDVMTLDIQMPKMDGIDFLKRLIPQYPMPVVVVTSIDEKVFDAMRYGAVDFLVKPDINNVNGLEGLVRQLIARIKVASKVDRTIIKSTYSEDSDSDIEILTNFTTDTDVKEKNNSLNYSYDDMVIAIGSSTGGTEAISHIIKSMAIDMPPILIVQHMPPVFTKLYADRLNSNCQLEIKEAKNMDRVTKNTVLIASGENHMELKKDSNGYYVKCYKGDKVSGHCPSVDVLFNSVADVAQENAIGVILTGMGHDGAKGLLKMRNKGAYTIGQDMESCVVYGMPKVAFEIGAVKKQVSLQNINQIVNAAIKQRSK